MLDVGVVTVDRLTAEDRLILWPDAVWPQDVGAVAVLDGGPLLEPDGRLRLEAARAAVATRLHRLPRFRQQLCFPRRGLGGPLWVDSPAFDLAEHVRVMPVPPPGGDAQLLDTVERLRRGRLERSKPLWEMWFLPGLSGGRVGLFVRLHHVVADGMAGVANLAALLDATPDAAVAPPPSWLPASAPTARELLADNLRRRAERARHRVAAAARPVAALHKARAAWPVMRELLAQKPGPKTSLDVVIGPRRRLGVVRADLDLVARIAHAHGGTVNDVLLALTAGGLRRLLSARGEAVDDLVLPVYVPVSLRRGRAGPEDGNLISQMAVHLPLGTADPGRLLRQIAVETAQRKALARPSLGVMFGSRLVRGAMLKLIVRQRVNVVTADLSGPTRPRYFAGARLLEMFPLVNLLGNESLGVGGLSYAGQLAVMAVADAGAYPDLQVFVAAAEAELHALADTTDSMTALAAGRD